MIRSLLVPVDGSAFSEQAIPVALGVARPHGAVINLVLVHFPEALDQSIPSTYQDTDRLHRLEQQEYLAGLKKRLPAELQGSVQTHLFEGVVAETLEYKAQEMGVDMVVMSTHGRGFLSRAVLGSNTDRLIRSLAVPVLVVHTQNLHPALVAAPPFRRVLVPLDGSELSEKVLARAMAVGQPGFTEYLLVRVVRLPFHFAGHPGGRTAESERAQLERQKVEAVGYLEWVASPLRAANHVIRTRAVFHANPAGAILEEAQTAGCDLIAIATHARAPLPRLFIGSVADKVIRGASIPVLVHAPK